MMHSRYNPDTDEVELIEYCPCMKFHDNDFCMCGEDDMS